MKSFNRIRQLNRVICDIIDKFELNNAVVADIATDHGYLAEQISRNEKVSRVIATDISEKCLEKTNQLKKDFNLNKVQTKLGDGLDPIEVADLIAIAGVGGYEIIKMLDTQNMQKNGENKCDIFVLQPSKNAVDLRLYLIEKNIKIELDFVCFSGGKFYPIIVANLTKKNDTDHSIFNLYFGRDNCLENADFLRFLEATVVELKFVENLDKESIKNSNDLKTKFGILNLAKNLLKKSKGD